MSTGPNPVYPALIANQNYGQTTYLFPYCGQEPRTYNGKDYVVVPYTPILPGPPTSTVEVTVFGSSDAGATWTELDSGNRKPVTFTAKGQSKPYGVVRDGSILFVVLLGATGMEIEQFNMATETWGAQVANTGPAPDDCDV